jgi:chromosome segregation ATPase
LDVAYEKLDTYVEQSVEQLLSAMNEQRKTLEDWVEQKLGSSEEKLAAAVATVQQTRSVLDSAVSSLSASGKPASGADTSALKARLTSLEERLASGSFSDNETRERLKAYEERLASDSLIDAEARNRLTTLEERLASESLLERIQSLEEESRERIESLEEQMAAFSADTMQKNATSQQTLSPTLRTDGARLTALEDRLMAVGGQAAALETVLADLARTSSDHSVAKDMQSRIFDARTDSLQAAVSDLAARFEAVGCQRLPEKAQEQAALEERFTALQTQLNSVVACNTALESALSAISERQSSEASRNGADAACQLDKQAELVRDLEKQLADKVCKIELRLQEDEEVLKKVEVLEERENSLEARLQQDEERLLQDESKIETSMKNIEEVQDLKWRHESFATNLDQLARRVQEVLDQSGSIDAQLQAATEENQELRKASAEQMKEFQMKMENLQGSQAEDEGEEMCKVSTLSQEVQSGLADFFGAQQLSPKSRAASLKANGNSCALKLQSLEDKVVEHEKKFSEGLVSRKDHLQLRARVEGGFDAVVVRIEANRWMGEESGVAGDAIMQAFTFNLDSRLSELEHRLHKSDAVLDKLLEKNHIKVKKVTVAAHCLNCGQPFGPDADHCSKCGAKKHMKQILVPKRAVRAAQEHNFTLVKIAFDLWARGKNANCLKSLAKQLTEEARLGDSVSVASLTRSDTAQLFHGHLLVPKRSKSSLSRGRSDVSLPDSDTAASSASPVRGRGSLPPLDT